MSVSHGQVGHGKTISYAPIAQGAAGSSVLVAAAAGKRIKVVNFIIVLSAAGTVKFADGGADLTGAMSLVSNGGVSAPGFAGSPWFQTGINSALSIVTTGGAASGSISYFLES